MTAVVYPAPNGFHVSLRIAECEVDDAGPFDDVTDAVMMAERWSDEVAISETLRTTKGGS